MRMRFTVFLLAVALFFPSANHALDQTDTGFIYPIGTEHFNTGKGWWLSKDPDYFPGLYHVGVDMMTGRRSGPVYAIADGRIITVNRSSTWGAGNCALVIEHKTGDGQVFIAIYAHLIESSVISGGGVYVGQPVGKTGIYLGDGDQHLHFAIHDGPYSTMAKSGWGMMPVSQWNTSNRTNTFTDPIAFIKTRYAYNPSTEEETACIGNICWSPKDVSCENATHWYRLREDPYVSANQPLAFEAGPEACDEIQRQVERIAQNENSNQEVPEEHWWQSWWRAIQNFFGIPASADDIRRFIVYRTISVQGNNGQHFVVSGNGVVRSHATGSGYATVPTDAFAPSLPDLIVHSLTLTTSDGHERYKFNPAEKVKMAAKLENIGAGNPSDMIEVHFYLSKGYKEDAHSDWVRVGKDFIQPGNLRSGDTHTEEEEFVPTDEGLTPGIYNIVVCVDHPEDSHNNGGDIPEEHESNNCSTEAVFEVRNPNAPTDVDLIITSVEVKAASLPIRVGDGMGVWMTIKNIGIEDCPAVVRSAYEINGPSTGGNWVMIADDGTDAEQLGVGMEQMEEINSLVPAPAIPGIYKLRVRADYLNAVLESDETNNILETSFEVIPLPVIRTIAITSPKSGDKWRTDKEYKIQWTSQNVDGKVRIEFSTNGGGSWNNIDSGAANDGSKKWKPPKDKIKKDADAYIRITSCSYPSVSAVSSKFRIDHKK